MEEINQGTQANLVRALSCSKGVVSNSKIEDKEFFSPSSLKNRNKTTKRVINLSNFPYHASISTSRFFFGFFFFFKINYIGNNQIHTQKKSAVSTYIHIFLKRLKMKIYGFPNYISIEILLLLNLINQKCNLSMAVISMHLTLHCLFFPVTGNLI